MNETDSNIIETFLFGPNGLSDEENALIIESANYLGEKTKTTILKNISTYLSSTVLSAD